MEKLDDPIVQNHWIIYRFHFHFIFPHQILDPNTALGCVAYALVFTMIKLNDRSRGFPYEIIINKTSVFNMGNGIS